MKNDNNNIFFVSTKPVRKFLIHKGLFRHKTKSQRASIQHGIYSPTKWEKNSENPNEFQKSFPTKETFLQTPLKQDIFIKWASLHQYLESLKIFWPKNSRLVLTVSFPLTSLCLLILRGHLSGSLIL